MVAYKVLLQGLKFGETDYVDIPPVIIRANSDREANDMITDAIYTIRLDNHFYRMKYVSKVLYDETECDRNPE